MVIALRVIGAAFMQIYTHAVASLGSNVVSILLSLPIVAVVAAGAFFSRSFLLLPLGVGLLLAVLPNPAAAGTQFLNHLLANGDYLTFGDYRAGLREYWRFALRCWLVSVAISILLIGNAAFYLRLNTSVSGFLAIVWLFVLSAWLAAHLYVYPLIMQQEVQRVLV